MQKGSRFIGIDPRDPPAFSASQPVQRRLQFFPVFRRDRIAGVFYRPVPGLAALLFEHGSERNVKAARKLDARHRLFQRIELCAECIQHGCHIGGLFRRIDVQERLIEFRNKYPIDCGLPRVDQLFRFQRHRKRAVVILRGLIRLSLIKQNPQCKLRVLPASEFFPNSCFECLPERSRIRKQIALLNQDAERFVFCRRSTQLRRCIHHGNFVLSKELSVPVVDAAPAFEFLQLLGSQFLRPQRRELLFDRLLRDTVKRCKVHAGIGALIASVFAKPRAKVGGNLGKIGDYALCKYKPDAWRGRADIGDGLILPVPALRPNSGFVHRCRQLIQFVDHRQSPLSG